tara:strand:- start:87 stop:590 length:504 start_codon:yes stop_codon:yes gene_type:complete
MNDAEEKSGFFGYLMRADYRFLQERDLGIDLYNSGYCGLAVFVLAVAVVTIFLLSIFHMIPRRKHVTILLPGTGCLAFAFGLLGTWLNHLRLEEVGKVLFSAAGGTLPVNVPQQAAIVILPLATGIAVLIASLAGYIYLLAFWTSDLFRKQAEGKKQKGSVKTRAGR